MLELLHTPTEMYPPSAQEFALRVRQSEKPQARKAAEASLSSQPRKATLVNLLIHLFGGPTLF